MAKLLEILLSLNAPSHKKNKVIAIFSVIFRYTAGLSIPTFIWSLRNLSSYHLAYIIISSPCAFRSSPVQSPKKMVALTHIMRIKTICTIRNTPVLVWNVSSTLPTASIPLCTIGRTRRRCITSLRRSASWNGRTGRIYAATWQYAHSTICSHCLGSACSFRRCRSACHTRENGSIMSE